MNRLPRILVFLAPAVFSLHPQTSTAQNFFDRWQARASATQSRQPGWAVPVFTQTTGLIQVARTDFIRQISPAHADVWNFDSSKGLNLIPWTKTEFDINLPPYIEHNSAGTKDGFGDFSFAGKYRIAAANEKHGNYTLMASCAVSIPTGSYKNGANGATVTPTVGGGKGFGRFDVQTTLGAALPHTSTAINSAGRPIAWNTVAQWRAQNYLWPEVESNTTFFMGGANGGKTQEFLMPGILLGKFKLHPDRPASRPGFAAGGGMQIATSRFHTYNHALVLTARWLF
jgi:hypothetical protein